MPPFIESCNKSELLEDISILLKLYLISVLHLNFPIVDFNLFC